MVQTHESMPDTMNAVSAALVIERKRLITLGLSVGPLCMGRGKPLGVTPGRRLGMAIGQSSHICTEL